MWKTRPVRPASQSVSANWPRRAEARGRPELDLALAGRAGGRIGRSLWVAAFHIGANMKVFMLGSSAYARAATSARRGKAWLMKTRGAAHARAPPAAAQARRLG